MRVLSVFGRLGIVRAAVRTAWIVLGVLVLLTLGHGMFLSASAGEAASPTQAKAAARRVGATGVMSRGNRRQEVFPHDVDRQDSLRTLAEDCQEGLVAVTSRVASQGPLRHNRHPRLLGQESSIPSVARCFRYWPVPRMSAIMSRPPGRKTRMASLMTFFLPEKINIILNML
jgi:hypothetical protein